MKPKSFLIAALACVLLCFGALGGFVMVKDPFFAFHGPAENEKAVFSNERYEMAGLIRNEEYSSVVMGTSLAANYRASWFTEGLGEKTLKITFPDGWISEFDTALRLAFRAKGDLDTVCFSLDPNIITRPDSSRTVELPGYLYDLNPLNEIEYLLSADTYQLIGRNWLNGGEGAVTLDDAYVWDGEYIFSYGYALAGYPRPAVSDRLTPADAYLAAAEENLDVMCAWVEEHPDTCFKIWFPPYSILYWDKTTRDGTAEAVLTAVEYAGQRLLAYDNVELYSFLQSEEIITDLNNYTDHIHCSGGVTYHVARSVMGGDEPLTAEKFSEALAGLRQLVVNYDYTAIFPET